MLKWQVWGPALILRPQRVFQRTLLKEFIFMSNLSLYHGYVINDMAERRLQKTRSTVMYLMIPLQSYEKCYLKARSLSDQANLFWRESARRNHWNRQNDEGDRGPKEPPTRLTNHVDTPDQLKMTTTTTTRLMNRQTNRQTDRQTDKHLPPQFHNFTISLLTTVFPQTGHLLKTFLQFLLALNSIPLCSLSYIICS